jgi:2-methylcitrate dehydratase PrpD
VAAAVVSGRVGIDTFDDTHIRDTQIAALMPRVAMRVDAAIGTGKPALTEARVHVRLNDGRMLVQDAHGARGYPSNPASQDELDAKFLACAGTVLRQPAAGDLLRRLRGLETMVSIAEIWG